MESYTGLEIAVIGMAGRFPQADNIEAFWDKLKHGVDCISSFSKAEAIGEGEPAHIAEQASYVASHAYMQNKQYFDAAFFNYLPDEAELMDPQVRIYHELCWEALEDSGYAGSREKQTIGVFAAGSPNPRWVLHAATGGREGLVDAFTAAHLRDVTFLSSRIAYKLNLKGPAVYLQTACSSSLVAIHHACNSLLLGECNMALAGGVCVKNYSKKGYLYQEGMIRSKDGKCRPFDRLSSGTVGGEGAGVVVLKRLKDAMLEHDHIYAIVKGTAINNDGSGKVGYTAPGVKGQAAVIRKALKMAKLSADSITYVETHGTATQLGDPIEIEALTQVFNRNTVNACWIGSVKSNIGHLDAAAGVAGFIKTVLSLQHRQLPPTLHYTAPNPNIDFKDGVLEVNSILKDWDNEGKPLRAGVSSFGIGGTNAHLILEEAPRPVEAKAGRNFHLIALSARTSGSLDAASSRLAGLLQRNGSVNLADVESVLLRGRERFAHRKVFVCENVEEAAGLLSAGDSGKDVVKQRQENLQHTVFLFSGQGAQYPRMAYDLYQSEPFFRKTADECLAMAARYTTLDLKAAWMDDNDQQLIHRTEYAQPLLFIVEYAMAQLLLHWGIKPDHMIGHSIGEYTAACISGVFKLEDAIRLVIKRGALMGSMPEGSMLSIGADMALLSPLLGETPGVELAAINGASALVVGGTDSAIEQFSKRLTGLAIHFKKLKTSHAFHCHLMEGILSSFEKEVASVRLNEPQIPYVSNLTGGPAGFAQLNDPAYWSRHLRETVQFARGADYLLSQGRACFIELGPGRTLTELVGSSPLRGEEHVLVNTLRQAKQQINDQKYLIDRVGQLWLAGLGVDWEAYYEGQMRNKLSLPTYAFEKTAYTTDINVNKILDNPLSDGSEEVPIEGFVHVSGWKRGMPVSAGVVRAARSQTILIFSGTEPVSRSLIEKLTGLGHQVIPIRVSAIFAVGDGDVWQMDLSRQDHYRRLWQYLKDKSVNIDRIIHTLTFGQEPGDNSYEAIDDRLQYGYMGLSFLAGSIAEHQGHPAIAVSVVTNHIAHVFADDRVDPLKATLLAPAKIMPSEVRDLSCKVIDLAEADGQLDLLIREILYPSSDPLVALRMKERWVQHFEPLSEGIPSGVRIKKNGCYLVTGGFGGMGSTIARHLALEYQAHVLLTHRADPPEHWEQELKVMQDAGSRVTLYRLDVSDETRVKELAGAIENSGVRLDGLIWAVGEPDHGGIMQMRKPEDYSRYLRSKVHGLLLFEKYLSLGSLELLALFSSIGNTFYQHKFGQIGYNAANEFLESYAISFRRRTGVHAFAINWCDWNDVGMTYSIRKKQLKTDNNQEINAAIAHAIYPQEGVRVFELCVQNNLTVASIYKGDIRKALRRYKDDLQTVHAGLGDPATGDPAGPGDPATVPSFRQTDTPGEILLMLFSEFFGKPAIDPKDDFFELGGDSLKAMTLVARINKKIGTSLTLANLYEHPSVEKLAHFLTTKTGAGDAREKRPIPTAAPREYYPLSSEQKKLFFLQELQPLSTAYNESKILWLQEEPDREKLTAIFNLLLERHESLRTNFFADKNGPHQVIRRNAVIGIDTYQWKGDAVDIIRSFIRPFDLASDLLLRVAVCRKPAGEYLLMIDSHHIVMDGISKGILIDELLTTYAGEALPGHRITYKDYAFWQSSPEGQADRAVQKAFWMDQYREEVSVLDLPTDFPRPRIANSDNGGNVELRLSEALTRKLEEVQRQSHTTMFNLLLAAFAILLYRLSRQKDLVIGIPVSTRTHADLERMIGMFSGTLPVRFDVGEHLPFEQFLRVVKEKVVQCIGNQGFPMEELIDELKMERSIGRMPLADVMFVYEDHQQPVRRPAGLSIREANYKPIPARNDLTLMAVRTGDMLVLNFLYARDLFRPELMERYASYFEKILLEITRQPDRIIAGIDLLSKGQKEELLYGFNQTDLELPDRTVVSWFEERVRNFPGSPALVFGDTRLTYKELNENANRLAHTIQRRYKERYQTNMSTGTPVALYLDRGMDMVISMLAVLKAGGAYLPVSPSYPEQRIGFLLEDARPPLIVTQSRYATRFMTGGVPFEPVVVAADEAGCDRIQGCSCTTCPDTADPGISIAGTDLAYVIYTSGTTGAPKGVMIDHRNLLHHICAQIQLFDYPSCKRTLFSVDYVFDGSVFQLFVSLCCGLEVYICNEEQQKSAVALEEIIERHRIDIAGSLPSMLALMKESPSLKVLITAGETPSVDLLKRFSRFSKVFNVYGPTECTITATANLYREGDQPHNIGQPLTNTRCYVLDEQQRLAPVGVPGELYIGGAGLSSGYLNRPELMSRFIDHPFPSEADRHKGYLKLYNTGDLVRWLPDGRLEFMGRKDLQVKIRGHRIELGEVESVLNKHAGIVQAVVIDREKGGHKYLAAYFVPGTGVRAESSTLQTWLASKLPGYMVPGVYVPLDAIPLTINGKVDRKKLPEPEFTDHGLYVGPENELEALLCRIWQEVLGISKVGVNDNFFSLGGDSIKSIQVSSRLRNKGYAVPVKEIFANQTVRTLASTLESPEITVDQTPVTGRVPISPIQHWFLNGKIKNKAHFNQSVMLNFPGGVRGETIRKVFEKLAAHHDMLRCVFRDTEEGYVQAIPGEMGVFVEESDLRNSDSPETIIGHESQRLQSGMDLANGPLWKLALYHMADGTRLFIVIHHLIIDGVSWRIIFEDMQQLLDQLRNDQVLSLPMKTTSYRSWSEGLAGSFSTVDAHGQREHIPVRLPKWTIGRDYPDGTNTFGDTAKISFSLSEAETSVLLKDIHFAYHTQINDILLAALATTLNHGYGMADVSIDMEGHGRIPADKGSGLERTVGWFTAIYPVVLATGNDMAATIKMVKESLRSTRTYGVDYVPEGSKLSFNYLGQFDTDLEHTEFKIAGEPRGSDIGPDEDRLYEWDISGIVTNRQLHMTLAYSGAQYRVETIRSLMEEYSRQLVKIIRHCSTVTTPQLTPSDLTYRGITQGVLDALQQQYPVEDIYPLSPMQEGLFFHSSLERNAVHYFEQMTIDLEAEVNMEKLTAAFQALIDRYPILRTIFRHKEFERPLQIVLARSVADVTFVDTREQCKRDGEEAVIAFYEEKDKKRGFDPEHGPLLRLTVLRTGTRGFTLIWSHHHILMDGWSAGVVWGGFVRYYTDGGTGSGTPARYAEYIQWIEGRDKTRSAAFWKAYLNGYHQLVSIPGKQHRPAEGKAFELCSRRLIIDPVLTRALRSRAERNEVTLNTMVQCAWGILLGKYNYTGDVVFGAVVSGRPAEIQGIEEMVGLCINTLPVRIDLEENGDSIDKLLQQIQRKALEAEPYHSHPLPEIQAASSIGSALLDHIVVFENYPIQDRFTATGSAGLNIKRFKGFEQTNYDLTVVVVPRDELQIKLDFNAQVYSPEIMDRTLLHLQMIIGQLADAEQDALSGITILSPGEQERLTGFNRMETGYPEKTITGLFEEQVSRTPDNIALVFEGREMTYRELNGRANLVGRYLREQCHIQREDRVGICLDRGFGMLCGIIGILKAGGAYVPIDPVYPRERAEYMFSDSGCKVLVDEEFFKQTGFWEADRFPDDPEAVNSPGDLAYVIYTSGTSGKPKGAQIEHRNVIRLFKNEKPLFDFNEKDVWTLFHSFCFDFSVWEMYGALLFGGKLVIVPQEMTRDAVRFGKLLQQQQVTVLNQTPRAFYVLQEIILSTRSPLSVRYVIFGGEALDPSLLKSWQEEYNGCRLVNMYGITETTVHVTYKEIGAVDTLSKVSNIGKPIPTLGCYIMDRTGGLLPPGIAGELYVGGAGVSRGYINRPELTAERFIPNPYGPGHLYRTGDIGRWLSGGDLEYLGRADEQVKIRGFRIELGEIESQLKLIPEIGEAVVVVAGPADDRYLAGYYTAGAALDPGYIQERLSQQLPHYMIPAHFIYLEAIPLTGNGKLDRRSLPEAGIEYGAAYQGPANEIEEQLTHIWAGVLRLEASRISVHSSFFELGGHSLKAVLLVNKINRAFEIHFPLEEVFKKRTISSMADYLTTILQTAGVVLPETGIQNTIEIEL